MIAGLRKAVRRRHGARGSVRDFGKEADLTQNQVRGFQRAGSVVLKRFGEPDDSAVAGVRHVEVAIGIHVETGGRQQTGLVGPVRVVRGVVRERTLEIGLPNDDIGLRAGLQVAEIFIAENPVVISVRNVKMRRRRGQIDRNAGVHGVRTERRKVELTAFDQIERIQIQPVLPQNAGGRTETGPGRGQHHHTMVEGIRDEEFGAGKDRRRRM